MIKIITFW